MKLNYFLLVLITLFSKNSYTAGFMPDEIVHSSAFTCEIQNLKVGDEATSFDGEKVVADKIIKNEAKYCDSSIKIIFKDAALTVTPDQLLYLPKVNDWVAAKNLKSNDLVLSITGDLVPVIGIEQLNKVMRFYDLTIRDQHNFFVSKLGILVHNEPFIATALVAAGATVAEVAVPYVAKAAVWGAAGYIGCKLSKQSDRPANPIFPVVPGDYTQVDKDRIQRAEAQESSKKARAQEKKHEAEKQIRKSKEPAKKAASPRIKAIPAKNSIQKNEVAVKPADGKIPQEVSEKPAEEEVPKEEAGKSAEEEVPKEVSEEKTKETKIKTVEDLQKEAKRCKTVSSKVKQYEKPGDFDKAKEDFGELGLSDIKKDGDTTIGVLPDGRRVNVREESSETRPTLEIYDNKTKKSIKIRYGS